MTSVVIFYQKAKQLHLTLNSQHRWIISQVQMSEYVSTVHTQLVQELHKNICKNHKIWGLSAFTMLLLVQLFHRT